MSDVLIALEPGVSCIKFCGGADDATSTVAKKIKSASAPKLFSAFIFFAAKSIMYEARNFLKLHLLA